MIYLGKSSSSSTCNVSGVQNPSVSCCGGGECMCMAVTPTCYCGEKSMLRTTRIAENRGKKMLGLPKLQDNLC